MSSQSWLDYRIKRINYFLRVVLVSTIYYKHKSFITSTHTNYFDQVFKERGVKLPVELDNYTDPIQFVNTLLTLFFIPNHRSHLPNPDEADHYNLLSPLVNILANFISCCCLCQGACPERTAHSTAFSDGVKKLFYELVNHQQRTKLY